MGVHLEDRIDQNRNEGDNITPSVELLTLAIDENIAERENMTEQNTVETVKDVEDVEDVENVTTSGMNEIQSEAQITKQRLSLQSRVRTWILRGAKNKALFREKYEALCKSNGIAPYAEKKAKSSDFNLTDLDEMMQE